MNRNSAGEMIMRERLSILLGKTSGYSPGLYTEDINQTGIKKYSLSDDAAP